MIIGPQGSGKGTQSKLIAEKYNLVHISTGDMFKDAATNKTEMGLLAKTYWKIGNLVPDEITNKLALEKLNEIKDNFILDGYPRNIYQTKILEKHYNIDLVILLNCSEELSIKRIGARRVCPNCKSVYNMIFNPPKLEGICDVCGNNLIKRKDDNEEAIKKRLNTYYELVKPILDFYKDKIIEVDGSKKINEIQNIINHEINTRLL